MRTLGTWQTLLPVWDIPQKLLLLLVRNLVTVHPRHPGTEARWVSTDWTWSRKRWQEEQAGRSPKASGIRCTENRDVPKTE